MIKRILSMMMALVMLVSLLPLPNVSAEATGTVHTHSDAHTCGAQCGGNAGWTEWTSTNALPTDSGHYYLTGDVQLTTNKDVAAGKDITICLNGYDLKSASNKRIGYVYGKLTISDCTAYEQDGQYISGRAIGGTAADGAVLSVRRGGTLVLEGGKITGGTTTGTAGGGGVYLQKGTSEGPGGVFYMYGGEISGNEGQNGGGVCVGGADSGYTYAAFYMYGGTITGNSARANGGGVYVVSRSTVEIVNGTVTGNTATNKAKSVYMDGGYSKLTVSGCVKLDDLQFGNTGNAGLKVNGLTNGTQITMTTVATDMTKIVSVANGGAQDSWSAHWVTANGESVSVKNGAFVSGHYHGDIKYQAYTGGTSHNTLPNGSNRYYLTNDIVRNASGNKALEIAEGTTQYMCLNGHTITHRNPEIRLYNIKGNYILEDCSAYTDAGGNYISGGITYGGATTSTMTNGMLANVSRGGSMTMTGGQIYGFTSELASSSNAPLIYLQGATATAKTVFNMQGGEIHSNTSNTNGALILVMKADAPATTMETYTQINISGGKIWGNTSTSGGLVAAVSNHINITGGTITGNNVKKGAVYGRNENNITVSGAPTIYGNNGGNLYITDNRMLTVGEMTGGKIGIGANRTDDFISNELTAQEAAYFVSDDGAAPLNYKQNKLFLGEGHEHGVDGKAGSEFWIKWEKTDELPTIAGNYYLADNVQLKAVASLEANVNLCLCGKTITAASGKRIMNIGGGATVTITDCQDTCGVLTGGNSNNGGAINVSRGSTLNLYNGTITGNASTDVNNGVGGAIYLQAANTSSVGAVFNMYGGTITNNNAAKGGAIGTGDGVETDKTLTQINIYGGEITDNKASNNGGAIRTGKYCVVNIRDTKLTGNASGANGGAIHMGDTGSLNIQNSEITDNTAKNGGAIYISANGSLNIQDSAITGNTASATAGGVYFHSDATELRVAGKAVVADNKCGTKSSNIHLKGDTVITAENLTDGAKLFVTADKIGRAITNAVDEASAAFVHTDNVYRMLTYKDGKVYIEISNEHIHCECFGKTKGCDHEAVVWQAWESDTTLPTTSGYYYLLNDVTLAARANMDGNPDVHICLNGKTVTAPENNRLIQVKAGATVTITDCGETGKLTGGSNTYGGAINVNRNGVLNLFGGTITGNKSTKGDEGLGGAIYLQTATETENGGVFNMYGGVITGNEATKGGAIAIGDGKATTMALAQINIYGGQITNNKATNNGGAIRTGGYSVVNIQNATFSGNTSGANGGVINATKNDTLNMQGVVLTKNTATNYGGAVYGGATTTIANTQVIENSSGKDGGAIYCNGVSAKISQSKFEKNLTKTAGGAVGFSTGCKAEIKDSTFTGNTAANGGAVIVQGGADLVIAKTTFTGNSASLAGGSVYVSYPTESGDRSELTLDGCSFTKSESGNSGGAVFVDKESALDIRNVTFTGTTAGGNGGAVYAGKNGVMNIQDSVFTEITAGNYGGAVYSTSKATVTGTKLSGITSVKDGGAIYCGGESAVITKCEITGNTVTKGAGGGMGFSMNCVATVQDCTVSGNTATYGGAAIIQGGADVTIKGGTYTANNATQSGGAFYVNVPNTTTGKVCVLTVDGAVVTESAAKGNGGAIYANAESTLKIQNATISKSINESYGGAVYSKAETTISGSKLTDNTSGKDGGAVYCAGVSAVVTNSDFSGNKVIKGAGGAIGFSFGCQAVINGGTFTQNTAANGGAVIVQGGADLTIQDGIFAKNVAELYAGAIYVSTPTAEGDSSVLTIEGGSITENKSGKNGGGLYMNKGELVMTGGTVSKNESPSYGGGMCVIGSTSKVTGGTIEKNTSAKDGAGAYFNGGTAEIGGDLKVSGNTSTSGAGGGLGFTKECKATLSGGTISGNTAGNAGGIIVQGQAHLTMTGGKITNNNTKAAGGGVYVNKSFMDFMGGTISGNTSVKNGGGLYSNASTLRFGGTSVSGNKAEGSGGGVFISKGKITFTGGTFANNHAERYGGGVYLSDTESTVNNIKVTGNSGVLGSGGFHCYKGTVVMNKVEATGNSSDTSCGGIYATQLCNLTLNDCLVEKNTSPRGAGVMANARASLTMNDVVVRYNEGVEGAGIYINSNVTNATINGGEITGNIARKRLSTENKMILGVGAGIYMKTGTKTSSGQSILHVNNTVIRDNEAEGIGGAAYVAMQMHMYLDGCTIENNKSGDMGAGIYQESGTLLSVKNTDIIGNTGVGNGSAIYAGSDFTLDGGKITGNKTTDGTAVYVAPARYDGHSYTNATVKLGGDLVIFDNEGTMEGDLYFDEGVAAAGTAEGFGENTKIKIQLHSGVLTNSLLAAYHYEGGDQVYTITYGDRSLTEPEYEGESNLPGEADAQNIVLYAAVGAFVLAVAAVVILLLLKKKKAAAAATKE